MKRLFFFVMMVLISLPSYSADYRLPFVESQNGVTKIPFVENEWVLGSERVEWKLYIEKGMLEERAAIHEFHAVTVFKEPYYNDAIKSKIAMIYTYGALNCRDGNLHILHEWYVNPEETLVDKSNYEFGAYTVEMLQPNTARNEIYNQICKESI
mgnify:CR=1 FL=1